MYECKVVKDSVTPDGHRITSLLCTYPRSVHAEMLTHRQFSRNAASNRAVGVKKVIERVKADPYIPEWTKNQPGMQGRKIHSEHDIAFMTDRWLDARDYAIRAAMVLSLEGAHKQDVNRLLEPWQWITVLYTATEWDGFFALRTAADAHPAVQRIARMMYLARHESTPQVLNERQWHLPFTDSTDYTGIVESVARCAWLSYERHDKASDRETCEATHKKLRVNGHMSPFEHQARPQTRGDKNEHTGNFRHWVQFRKTLPGECRGAFRVDAETLEGWKK